MEDEKSYEKLKTEEVNKKMIKKLLYFYYDVNISHLNEQGRLSVLNKLANNIHCWLPEEVDIFIYNKDVVSERFKEEKEDIVIWDTKKVEEYIN